MAYKKKKKAEESGDTEHGKLIKWVNEADDATLNSRLLAEKSRSYYDSEQWTDAERAKLATQKQAATVINRCKPKIDSLMGMESSNRTTAKAQPRTPKHTEGATAATEAVRFVLQDNAWEDVRADTWENMTIEGTGGIEINIEPKEDDSYKILIRNIMWDRLIYDPHSRRKNFSDARFLGQVVWMDYDEAVAKYPDAKDVLETMQSGSTTYEDKPRWMDDTRRRVKIVELYYKRDDGDWWYACFTYGGYCEGPKKSPFENEEGESEHAYEFASLFVDREGGRYGHLKQLLDIQDEINKRRSKALHLLSVRQTFGTAGAVADVQKAKNEMAKPDGHVEFAYGELNKDFGVLPTGDMVAGQFNLLGEAKMEMDSIGANAATMGKDKTVQSGVALRQRAMTGQTELAPMFRVLKNLDIRVYRKVYNRIRQYWKAPMWVRVTDDENNLKFVGLNQPVTQGEQMMKEAQQQMMAQKMPPEQMQMQMAQMQQQMAQDPRMQQVIDTSNDMTDLDVDIVMDDAPDAVTQEVEDFQAMAEMVKSGFPIPPEAVIMASPLSNKDKILKMMKENPQVPPKMQEQMQKMQEGMQKAGEEVQKLQQENQALKADQSSEQAKIQLSAQESQAKLQASREDSQAKFQQSQAEAQSKLALEREVQAAKIQLDREKAEADFALEKQKAEWDAQLIDMKQQNEHAMKKSELEFEQKCRSEDEAHKTSVEVAPQVTQMLEGGFTKAFEALTKALTEQSEMNRKLIEVLSKPKVVALKGIERNDDGFLTGASATVQ